MPTFIDSVTVNSLKIYPHSHTGSNLSSTVLSSILLLSGGKMSFLFFLKLTNPYSDWFYRTCGIDYIDFLIQQRMISEMLLPVFCDSRSRYVRISSLILSFTTLSLLSVVGLPVLTHLPPFLVFHLNILVFLMPVQVSYPFFSPCI